MATPKPIKRVPIELDKPRTMLIDWNAMFMIEEAITKRKGGAWISLQDLGDVKMLSIADMRTIIWGSLIHEDEALTEKQVGAMVHPQNSGYVCDKLAELLSGDEDDEEEKPASSGGSAKNGSDPLEGKVAG